MKRCRGLTSSTTAPARSARCSSSGVTRFGPGSLARRGTGALTSRRGTAGVCDVDVAGGFTCLSATLPSVFGLVLAANSLSPGPLPTPFGDLLLDPVSVGTFQQGLTASQRFDATVAVPNNPALIGVSIALQGSSPTANEPFRLGSAVSFVVQP